MKPGDVIPSNSVIIPADVAKHIAETLRVWANRDTDVVLAEWADLLDPQPPALREQAVAAFRKAALDRDWNLGDDGEDGEIADAVLAVVADWLAAQPLALGTSHDPAECVRGSERDHDVRLLRGRS